MVSCPSLSTTQPRGMGCPRASASFTLPTATAEVAMSRKSGPARSDGTAIAQGLVPSRASRPPKGATALGERPESAQAMPIMPASAAISG